MNDALTAHTLRQRPDLVEPFNRLDRAEWPLFMLQGAVPRCYRASFFSTFADTQIAICTADDQVVASGSAITCSWDGTLEGLPDGWDAVLERAVHDHAQHRAPTTLVGMSITVAQTHRGRRLGGVILRMLRSIAIERGFRSLIIPARPVLKSRYPLTPIGRYIQWTRDGHALFDPWLHIHQQLGARPLCIAPRSMVITGTIAEWEQWCGMRFPESGAYIVPGALQPVQIDREGDLGSYDDPNIWMHYALDGCTS